MHTRPIRIALQLQPQHADHSEMADALREAEDLGVDVVFTWDHFFPLTGDPDGKHFECWTMLAAWAAMTTRVEIGPLVSCMGYRNPHLTADMARTVDHISGGRLILGLGAGWSERDFVEYGYGFPSTRQRLDDFADGLEQVRTRLQTLNPPPVRKIPILLGGEGEKRTLPLVARYADAWHSFADPETIERKTAVLHGYCRDIGRDPAEIEISTGVSGGPSFVGEPDELGPRLLDLGVSLFTVGVSGPGYDFGLLGRWLEWRDAEMRSRP